MGDKDGVWKTRSVQRKPWNQRWADGALEVIEHVPWRVSENDPNVDGDKLVVEDTGERMPEPDVVKQKEAVPMPHRFMIKREDLERCGFSAGCPGCKAILRGTARQGHSEACRSRIEAELRDDPRVKTQKKRQDEFLARTLEEQDEKRRKVKAGETDKDESMGATAAGEAPGASSSATPAASSSLRPSPAAAPQAQEDEDMGADKGRREREFLGRSSTRSLRGRSERRRRSGWTWWTWC